MAKVALRLVVVKLLPMPPLPYIAIVLAILKAELAQNASGTNKDTQKARFLKETELLRKKLDSYHDFFIKLPLRIQTRKDYEFGKLSVEESLNAFETGYSQQFY